MAFLPPLQKYVLLGCCCRMLSIFANRSSGVIVSLRRVLYAQSPTRIADFSENDSGRTVDLKTTQKSASSARRVPPEFR